MKSIALTLVMSTLWMGLAQPRAEAMLIPSNAQTTVTQKSMSSDQETIQQVLENKEIQNRLHALGLSDADIQLRLSRLSDQQKHQLASQIRALNPAGDGIIVGLLVLVVLVLLIIYLAKRI